jgi:hypothetical protein
MILQEHDVYNFIGLAIVETILFLVGFCDMASCSLQKCIDRLYKLPEPMGGAMILSSGCGETARKSAYKLIFRPFKNIFIDHLVVARIEE